MLKENFIPPDECVLSGRSLPTAVQCRTAFEATLLSPFSWDCSMTRGFEEALKIMNDKLTFDLCHLDS